MNLQMKEYTNRDSQRPEGCVALDGGHTWPLFSTPAAWDILVAEDATDGGKQERGSCYKVVTIIFQYGTNMLQIAPLVKTKYQNYPQPKPAVTSRTSRQLHSVSCPDGFE